jgi:hypothetical protein
LPPRLQVSVTAPAAWSPLQEPVPAKHSLDLAFDIARRMSDPLVIERAVASAKAATAVERPSIYWRPYSIAQGDAGVALMFGVFDDCFPDQGWDRVAHQWIERASTGTAAEVRPLGGLFEGISGLAFTAAYLSRGGRRYRKLVGHLHDWVVAEAHAAGAEVDRTLQDGAGPFLAWDVIAGVTGIGTYLLSRGDHGALQPIAERLIALTRRSEGLPLWRTPPEAQSESMREVYPDGHLNCGLAHGIPGPLALLSLALLNGFDAPGLEEAIDRIATWLSDHRVHDDWGINWPSAIPLARREGGLVEVSCSGLQGTHAGWCYGSPGIARALWLAGKARANEAFSALALEAIRAVMRRPKPARQLASPALCHGVAGLMCIALRFRQEGVDDQFDGFARGLLGELEEMYEPETVLGFRTVGSNGSRIDQAGFLDGAPGIAMALLAASTDHAPAWDRLFLLS